jgi:hypothetical protein
MLSGARPHVFNATATEIAVPPSTAATTVLNI